MNDKGAELNKRVWTLFEKAGFETKPNSNAPAEEVVTLLDGRERSLDLSASVKHWGVKIIGENTTAKNLHESWTAYVHDFGELVKIAKANAGLFVLTRREMSMQDREYAEQRGIRVWGEEELRYYEAVVDAIGEYAKHEIVNSFAIHTTQERQIHCVLALQLHQPYSASDTNLFIFTMPPEKLLKTCMIYRKAQGSGEAYQRMVKKLRLRSVMKFVSQQDAILPTDIILHFSDNVTWDPIETSDLRDANGRRITLSRERDYKLVKLNIPMAYASLELIDGQHRLYGFVQADPATRENFNLVVLGMAGLPFHRRRDTFVAINDRARRMDPNLVAYLKYTDDEAECQKDNELMAIKIVVQLNKTSPFKNKVRLLDVRRGEKITLKGFSGYDLKGLLGPRGLLRKYYPNESKEYIGALGLYFGVLKSLFKEQWEQPERYIIFTNRGISAFLKLSRSILKTCQSHLTKQIVLKYLQPLKDRRSDSDWETNKLRSAYVGAKGWKDFHRDLVSTIRAVYPDFQE